MRLFRTKNSRKLSGFEDPSKTTEEGAKDYLDAEDFRKMKEDTLHDMAEANGWDGTGHGSFASVREHIRK